MALPNSRRRQFSIWASFTLMVVAVFLGTGALLGQTPVPALGLPPGDGPLEVQTSFHLLAVHDINDETESFKFSGILTLVWKDGRRAFDPDQEGASKKLYSGAFQFNELAVGWYPQVILANAMDLTDSQGVLLSIEPDGTSILVQTITAEARTLLNLRKYPFDSQNLEAVFGVLGFNEDEVVLTTKKGAATANLSSIQIPQWDLTGIRASTRSGASPFSEMGGTSSVLTISLDTSRQSFFMMRLVIIPLMLIVVLSWSVFWMDRSSLGDRMSVSFVGILTAVAYQIMVSDIMPHISYITLMNAVLNFSFLIMCATVYINLRVGTLDNNGHESQGERLDLRCRFLFPLAYAALLLLAVIFCYAVS